MRGGLNSGAAIQGSAYSTATGATPAVEPNTQSVTEREALRIAGRSLTMEELLAIAVLVNAAVGLGTLYLEVRD